MLWGLRGVVLGLLLLAILNPSLPFQPIRTVVLLDQSPSVRAQVWKVAPQLSVGGAKYVAFASSAQTVAAPSARRLDLGEQTDLTPALELAQRQGADQIVLVSDGLFRGGVSAPAVPVFTLYQPPSPNASLSLLSPALPAKGQTVEVRAVVEATASTAATLVLSGPAGSQTRQIKLEAGRQSYGYRFRLEQPTTVTATLKSSFGTQQTQTRVSPSDASRVWVLGDPALAAHLSTQGFAVSQPKGLAQPLEAEVIALGVGAGALSGGEMDLLKDFLTQGGSVLWTATPNGLFFGGWERSVLAEALPIEPQEEPAGVGLVLVLDVSGSMDEANKLSLAVTGATELVRSARIQDYIGVLTFSDRARWLFRPRQMSPQGRREAEAWLDSLSAEGGTHIGQGYAEALEALQALPTPSKQVLFLSDGLADDAGPDQLELAKLTAPQIRTSTVAVGQDADREFLRNLAMSGQGSFWDVPRPQDLPRFFLDEASRNFKRQSLEGRFAVGVRAHPISRNVSPAALRVVLPSRAKPWAQEVLFSNQGSVLAVGESGRGRVAALSTDLTRSWRDWPQASALLGELMRWLSQTPARPKAQASRENQAVTVVLEGQFEQPRLRWEGLEQAFAPVGPLRYQALLPANAVGIASVVEGEQTRLSLGLPDQPEWSSANGQENLKRLAEASGGRALQNPAELSTLTQRKSLPLRPWLLGLALVCFLLERYLERRAVVRSLTLSS